MAYIIIDREKYFYNLSQLALKSGSKNTLAIVLKDNAYGHGLELMAQLASEYGIKEAVVISYYEAITISKYFDRVLVLNDIPKYDTKCSFAISNIELLENIETNIQIELKVDTGMHRNGIIKSDLQRAVDIIKRRKLNLIGVFTHYRSADILSSEFAWQQTIFKEVKSFIVDSGFKNIRFHSYNSAALLRSNSFDEDIARVGIATYGYNELPDIYKKIDLKPVLSLMAKKINSRFLKKGSRIGYGGEYTTPKDMIISTYDIGYGDGLRRGNPINPLILPNGKSILGRVSMDFISVESTQNEICIIDNALNVANHYGTISYEILTALSPNLPRYIK